MELYFYPLYKPSWLVKGQLYLHLYHDLILSHKYPFYARACFFFFIRSIPKSASQIRLYLPRCPFPSHFHYKILQAFLISTTRAIFPSTSSSIFLDHPNNYPIRSRIHRPATDAQLPTVLQMTDP